LLELDHNIKRGFNDLEATRCLERMLSADFLALDEMGKERVRDGDSFIRSQIERILKSRFDDGYPTLLATNADPSDMEKFYGASVASMIEGKYQTVTLGTGDFRKRMRVKMEADMGFGDE